MAQAIRNLIAKGKSSAKTKNRKNGFKRFVEDFVKFYDFTNINE